MFQKTILCLFAKLDFNLDGLACYGRDDVAVDRFAVNGDAENVGAFAVADEVNVERAITHDLLDGAFVPAKRDARIDAETFYLGVHTEDKFDHALEHPGAGSRTPALTGSARSVTNLGSEVGVIHRVRLAAGLTNGAVIVGLIPRKHLAESFFYAVGTAENTVNCELPS